MKVTIIGVGLIGGSIALKLQQKKFTDFVYGIDQNIENIKDALPVVHLGIKKEKDCPFD